MTHGGFRSLRSLHPCLPGRAGTTSSAGASSPSLALGSLSPSDHSVRSLRDLPRSPTAPPSGCPGPPRRSVRSGARRWRACGPFRVGYSLARNLGCRCVLSAWFAPLARAAVTVGPRSAGVRSAAAGVAALRPSAVSRLARSPGGSAVHVRDGRSAATLGPILGVSGCPRLVSMVEVLAPLGLMQGLFWMLQRKAVSLLSR